MADQEPTFRERLGGRWSLSLKAYLITAPLVVITIVVAAAQTWTEALGWALAGTVGMVAVGVWVYLLHRTIYRNRSIAPLPPAVVILTAALGAVLFVAVATSTASLIALRMPTEPWERIVPTVLAATWWSVTLTLILEASDRFLRERAILIDRAVQQQVASLQEAEVAARIRESIREDVNAELAEASAALVRRLDDIEARADASYAEVANELRDTAQTAVRPLSHRLAEQTAEEHPAPGFLTMVANIMRRQPFRPLALSLIFLVTTAPREINRLGTESGLISIAVTVALIVIPMTIFNALMRRWPQHHTTLFITGIVVVQGLTVALTPVYTAVTGFVVPVGDVVGSVVIGTFVIFITSGFGSWRITRRDMLRTFEQEISDDGVQALARNRAIADAAREASSVLHGSVQTKLVATAMAIDHGVAAGDMVAVNQALMRARAILEQPLASDTDAARSTLGEEIERKASLWRGLADIHVSVDPSVAPLTGSIAWRAGEVVEEGIANAVHHGRAQSIAVYAEPDGVGLFIRVVDDGSGPAGGVAGLGTRMLAEQAADWSLERTPEGTVLGVRLTNASPRSAQDAWA